MRKKKKNTVPNENQIQEFVDNFKKYKSSGFYSKVSEKLLYDGVIMKIK